MERKEFIEKTKIYKEKGIHLSQKQILESCERSIQSTINEDKFRGQTQATICVEELAELSQQITKFLRGKYDKIHLLEEFADVVLSLGYLKQILNIKDEDIYAAVATKYYLLKEILDSGQPCT